MQFSESFWRAFSSSEKICEKLPLALRLENHFLHHSLLFFFPFNFVQAAPTMYHKSSSWRPKLAVASSMRALPLTVHMSLAIVTECWVVPPMYTLILASPTRPQGMQQCTTHHVDAALESKLPTQARDKEWPSEKLGNRLQPREIPFLSLAQLEGIEAAWNFDLFLELLELVSDHDRERVRAVMNRVKSDLALLIQNQQRKGQCSTRREVRKFLQTEFAANVNFDRETQDIERQTYKWGKSPQAFTNNPICRYAVLESKFKKEIIPAKDSLIKRKLWKGLARELREKLEDSLAEGYLITISLTKWSKNNSFCWLGRCTISCR